MTSDWRVLKFRRRRVGGKHLSETSIFKFLERGVDGALVVRALVEYSMPFRYQYLACYLNVYINQLTISASCISPNDKIRMSTLTSTARTKSKIRTQWSYVSKSAILKLELQSLAVRVLRHPAWLIKPVNRMQRHNIRIKLRSVMVFLKRGER